jgi:hypothetical protein
MLNDDYSLNKFFSLLNEKNKSYTIWDIIDGMYYYIEYNIHLNEDTLINAHENKIKNLTTKQLEDSNIKNIISYNNDLIQIISNYNDILVNIKKNRQQLLNFISKLIDEEDIDLSKYFNKKNKFLSKDLWEISRRKKKIKKILNKNLDKK